MRLSSSSSSRPVVQLRAVAAPGDTRRRMPAGGVLVAGLICLVLWSLLDARSLYRSAQAAPDGARRTAALAVTHPLFDLSRWTGIDWVGSLVERGLGRNPDSVAGGVVAEPPPAPAIRPSARPGASPSASPTGPVVLGPLRAPTSSDPLRITVLGDSFAADLGLGVGRTLGSDDFNIVTDGRVSTGLTRPDYFNWIPQTAVDVHRYRPEITMVMIGANDDQNIVLPRGGGISYSRDRAGWIEEYRSRMDKMMDEATAGGSRLVWVGLPIVGTKPGLNNAIRLVNRIAQEEARVRAPNVLYVDSWHLFVNKKGRYSAYLPDADGHLQLMRSPDKVHLTLAGNEYLAQYVVGVLQNDWDLRL